MRWPDLPPLPPETEGEVQWHRESLGGGVALTIGRQRLSDGGEMWFGRTNASDLVAIRRVHDLIQSAVTEALRGHERHGWTPAGNRIAEEKAGYRSSPIPFADPSERREAGLAPAGPATGQQPDAAKFDRALQRRTPLAKARPKSDRTQETIWPKRKFADLRVAGQVMNTYLVCESSDGLILIDQHAAHERIVYEKLKNRHAGKKAGTQALLVPETVELGFREAGILEKLLPDFQAFGLEIAAPHAEGP